MIGRIRVAATDGIVPTIGLNFTCEVGGEGTMQFDALGTALSAAGALAKSAVLILELQTGPTTWVPVFPFVMKRPIKRKKVGTGVYSCVAVSLIDGWGGRTLFYPEYTTVQMLPGAGIERGLGWMNSDYDWQGDPREAWNLGYESSRTARPDGWPTGSGAKWISAHKVPGGGTDFEESERKLFRTDMVVPGSPGDQQVVRCYLSSDESASLWVAGEQVYETHDVEFGRKETHYVDLVLLPGTYGVGVDTLTSVTKGGDGVDPIIFCAGLLDDAGDITSWICVSSDAWGVTRRDDSGPGSEPPGPTPGEIIRDIIGEAAARNTCGWSSITFDFDGDVDSYDNDWAVATERVVRYGSDDYTQFFRALGETEADVWITPDLTMHAAPQQGETRAFTWTESHIQTMADDLEAGHGSVGMGLTHDGWVQVNGSGAATWREEFGLELGQALTTTMGSRIISAALSEEDRWDATFSYAPPAGQIPMLNFGPGDWISINYRGVIDTVRILSITGKAGEGGILWTIEVTNEVPA